MRRIFLALVLGALVRAPARAAEGKVLTDDTWRVTSASRLTIDAGLALGAPAALPTGLSTGAGAGLSFGGGLFAIGARGSWSTATESSIAWTVTQFDVRLRAVAAIQHTSGRGRMALRLGIGPTIVHERRVRNQGQRAGLSGSDLETSAFSARPAGDLELVIGLHVAGPWLLTLSGGPSLSVASATGHAGWTSQIGVGWQP
jgi:hypothetical protein